MNIELLSKMVKELLLDNDTVSLPGLGTFVAETVPAAFSDNGYIINPPYRRLFFRENIERDDDLLVKTYASENDVSEEVALNAINGFIAEIKELLNSRKSIVLPELGRLRATNENNYFFVPFENIDIYPEGEGLEPIPLKIRSVHTETEEETSEEGPVETPAEETTEESPMETPAEETTEEANGGESVVLNGVEVVRVDGSPDETEGNVVEEEPAKPQKTFSEGSLKAIIVLGSILLAFGLFIIIFIIISYLFPNFIDGILYP